MHTFLDNAFGHHVGSISDLGSGHQLEHDGLGQVVGHRIQLADGSWDRTDTLGHLVEHIRPFGDGLLHQDAHFQTIAVERHFAGHDVLQNPMGQTMLQRDPCSGNVTTAIGQLVGRIYSVR